MFAIARDEVKALTLLRDSASEHPVRESLWGIGLAAAGALSVQSAWESGPRSTLVIGTVLLVAAGLIAKHLLTKVPMARLETRHGVVKVAFEAAVEIEELESLAADLARELDWPVRRG